MPEQADIINNENRALQIPIKNCLYNLPAD